LGEAWRSRKNNDQIRGWLRVLSYLKRSERLWCATKWLQQGVVVQELGAGSGVKWARFDFVSLGVKALVRRTASMRYM